MSDYSKIRNLLEEALSMSRCLKHPVAAVIETPTGEYVIGYNGPSDRIGDHLECDRKGLHSGVHMERCPGTHAEIRAIANAAREGILIDRSTLYLSSWFPCDNCAKNMIEAGIIKFVTPDPIKYEPNSAYNFEMAERLMRDSGIEIIVNEDIRPRI